MLLSPSFPGYAFLQSNIIGAKKPAASKGSPVLELRADRKSFEQITQVHELKWLFHNLIQIV